jgi:hypothetical protein
MIGKVSMLTPWLATRIPQILFGGDLLQLASVTQRFWTPFLPRFITRLWCWNSVHKFRFQTFLTTPNLKWVEFFLSVARRRAHGFSTWNNLAIPFGAPVTKDIQVAETLFWPDVQPDERFPLERQWVCPTKKLAKQINHLIQQWRSVQAN